MRTWLLIALTVCGVSNAAGDDWYTSKSEWKGFERFHFEVDGKQAWMTVPPQARPGHPWVWRARFPNYHAEMDEALLADGFHVAWVDVAGLFGAPQAIRRGEQFYAFVTKERGLAKRMALEGVSRGGLFVYNWAARHPESVSCIYCDTPVCDIKSWPGGLGAGLGHEATWRQCLNVYKLDAKSVQEWRKNPVDHAARIASAKIPLLHVVAENDRVVPPQENTYLLQQRLRAAGHPLEVISVAEGTEKSNGHHFTHPDPERVVRFIRKHAVIPEAR